MTSFQIPEGPTRITLGQGGPATGNTAAFAVTNVASDARRARLNVQVGGGAKAEWFAIEGDRERMFAAGESQTVTVKAAVSPGTAPGDYRFRLRAVAVNDPDNDAAESPPVSLVLAGPAPKPGFPVWAWIVVALMLLAIAGVGAYFLFGRGDPTPRPSPTRAAAAMPDLLAARIDRAEAVRRLAAVDRTLDVELRPAERSDVPPDTVIGQAPAAGVTLPAGAPVRLTLSRPWFFGTWTGTLDGRPSAMRWRVEGEGPARSVFGDFSDGSTGRYVPLDHESHSDRQVFFRHPDGNHWMLAKTADGEAQGFSTWQGRQFPLVMSRRSLNADR